MNSSLTLSSSNQELVDGFCWAREQALAYVFSGDPVGDWYEAALPGREAFCMRDVAHQSTGAQVLGLAAWTHNMLRKFVANLSPARAWCSFWEINRYDLPAPVDYRSDEDFWYNLPANFDVLHCCYRQYLWTGDRSYIDDPIFRDFYARTVDEYVAAWDKDGDGIPEHYPAYGSRGIATYNEEVPHPLQGGDLIALQAAAYIAYAHILDLAGESGAGEMRRRAQHLRDLYQREWWDERVQGFAGFRKQDGGFATGHHGQCIYFPLLFGLVDDSAKARATLQEQIRRRRALGIEERTYLPELFYTYGRHDVAFAELMEQLAPDYARREYPEVSYAALGALATGMMGLAPDATTRTVTTQSRLTGEVDWVEMSGVPVFGNHLAIHHVQQHASTLRNLAGPALRWKAIFPGRLDTLVVDGQRQRAEWSANWLGLVESWVEVEVSAGGSCTVEAG
jgi:hypothetical protein